MSQFRGVTIDRVWIVEWLYWSLIHATQNYNYSSNANLHILQITTAPAKPFPARCVFTSHSLATASNSGDSSTSRTQDLSSRPSLQNSSGLIAPTALVITSRHEPHTKLFYCCICVHYRREHVYQDISQKRLQSKPQKTPFFCGCVYVAALPSNGHCLQSHCLVMGLYVTTA
jgi:hypothetical protein